ADRERVSVGGSRPSGCARRPGFRAGGDRDADPRVARGGGAIAEDPRRPALPPRSARRASLQDLRVWQAIEDDRRRDVQGARGGDPEERDPPARAAGRGTEDATGRKPPGDTRLGIHTPAGIQYPADRPGGRSRSRSARWVLWVGARSS